MQPIKNQTVAQINQIEDANMKAVLLANVQADTDFQEENISLWQGLGTYGGIFTIVIVAVTLFLIARQQVEVSSLR